MRHNSVPNLQKMMHNNPKLDLVNINVYTQFGQILSICSQDIEEKQTSDIKSRAVTLLKFGKIVVKIQIL